MGKRKLLIAMVTAAFTLNISSTVLATDNKILNFNNSGTRIFSENKIINQKSIPESYSLVSENENLALYLNEETLGIKIQNKNTGYLWESTIDVEQENLNQVWQQFAESALTIEYINTKGKLEKASISSKSVDTKISKLKDGFKAKINFKSQGISFELSLKLNQNSINISIENESIKESKDKIKLQSIFVYPFLGYSSSQEIGGYMFVPDGSGGLIRTDEVNTTVTEPYTKRVFGDDYGIKGMEQGEDFLNELKEIKYPVYGIAHNDNENAFAAIIENGAEYSEINAYKAGITTDYNWITSKFIFRDSYFQPTNKKGDGITVNQKERNNFDISVSYNFLENENANYIGMAKVYRNHLISKGDLKPLEKKENDIPMNLDILMSENKKSLLGRKIVKMTNTDDIKNIVDTFMGKDINNLNLTIRGATKGGLYGNTLNHFPLENSVGNKSDWKELNDYLKDKGIENFMYTDYTKGFSGTKGFSKNKDSGQTIANQIINSKNENYNFVAPKVTQENYISENEKFSEYGFDNITVDSLEYLYSNYNEKNASTRSEAVDIYKSMLNGKKLNLFEVNSYLWGNTLNYFNIPMSSSNYLIISDNVPFLQTVLRGYVDYYAEPLNFNSNSKESLLKMIEYGAYPSFYLTQEDSVKLIDTNSKWLYTSEFDILKGKIETEYKYINSALNNVVNESIIGRNVIENGVVETTYSNGVKILVNYNDADYKHESIVVKAKDFLVIGGK